ncbi:BTB/POZ domain-containing protein 19-like [Oscarella lobularis]|uniref:BTB/POZ domain-containing protein 19-like n=1 Tax=Oscarella lobularis TaxID=121494 RepID=UPI003313EE56
MSDGEARFGDPKVLAVEMSKILDSQDHSDIKFLVGEERKIFFGHKCILSARCEVFRAMFAEQSTKHSAADPYVLSDIKPPIFRALLEFLYTNKCTITADTSIDVLGAAIEYGLEDMARICVGYIRDSLSVDNVCEAIQAALTYCQDDLARECLTLIDGDPDAVFRSRGFTEMSEEALIYILQSDKLMADEGEILKAVKEWATVNSVVSGESMGDLCKHAIEHVRFPLIDPDELSFIEKENNRKKYIPIHLISHAWKFHAIKEVDRNDIQIRPRAGTLPKESLRAIGLAANK